jgi:hypothetical protein
MMSIDFLRFGAAKIFFANSGEDFLREYLTSEPNFMTQLSVGSYFDAVSDIDVLNTLHTVGLLPEAQRINHVATVRELAVFTPDAGFLDGETVSFLNDSEIQEILDDVRTKLVPRIEAEVSNWKDNFSRDESPSDYFFQFKSALEKFSKALAHDAFAVAEIEDGLHAIEEAISELGGDEDDESSHQEYYDRGGSSVYGPDSRSIFDDVDH